MILNNKLYDALKWIALVFLDAVGICYQALSVVWGLPYGDQVLQTCAAVSVCLGTLLGVSNAKYNSEKAKQDRDAYTEILRQNNELRSEIVLNADNRFENFEQNAAE